MENISNVPGCVKEVFEDPDVQQILSDHKISMDTDAALDYLLDLEVGPDYILRQCLKQLSWDSRTMSIM